MLMILTNSEDVTADYLASTLERHRVCFLRFDTDKVLERLAFHYDGLCPVIHLEDKLLAPDTFSSVWYRRPEKLKHPTLDSSPEGTCVLGEWSEALEGFFALIETQKWMNHPASNVAASHKVEQLTRARRLGMLIPDTLVTQDPDALRDFYERHRGRIIVKPMASGHIERPDGERDSLIYTNRVLPHHIANLDDLPVCPTLFQEEILKSADVRITVVDSDVHAVELLAQEDGLQRCDIRRNNMDDVTYKAITLPVEVEGGVRSLVASYGLRFAAIDMAVTQEGKWIFFEVNPNGQWAWLDLAGCANIAESFVKSFSGK